MSEFSKFMIACLIAVVCFVAVAAIEGKEPFVVGVVRDVIHAAAQ